MARPQTEHRFAVLDGLRGIGALMVLLYHSAERWPQYAAFPSSYLVLDMFFMLSGFVLAYAYEDRMAAGMSARTFSRDRMIRIYPLYLAGAVLGIATQIGRLFLYSPFPWWRLKGLAVQSLLSVAMIPNLAADRIYPFNAPEWSLFFELTANIAYAILLPRLSNRVLIALVVIFLPAMYLFSAKVGSLNVGYEPFTFFGGFVRVIPAFAIGVLLFRAWKAGRLARLPRLHPIWLLVLLLALASVPSRGPVSVLLAPLLVVIGLTALIGLGAVCEVRGRLASAFLFGGALSYPLYVVHYPMLRLAQLLALRFGTPLVPTMLVCGVLSIPLAVVAYLLWDVPVRGWLRRLSRRREARRTAAPA